MCCSWLEGSCSKTRAASSFNNILYPLTNVCLACVYRKYSDVSSSDSDDDRRARKKGAHKKHKKKSKKKKKKGKKKSKKKKSSYSSSSSSSSEDEHETSLRSAISGKKIRRKLDKTQEDVDNEKKREQLLKFYNGMYD